MYGRDQQLVQLLVQEPPLSPHNLETAMVSSRSVNIKWQQKSGDSNEVFKFIVEFREADRKYHHIYLLNYQQIIFTLNVIEITSRVKYNRFVCFICFTIVKVNLMMIIKFNFLQQYKLFS